MSDAARVWAKSRPRPPLVEIAAPRLVRRTKPLPNLALLAEPRGALQRRPPSRAPHGVGFFRQRRQVLIAPRLGPWQLSPGTPRQVEGTPRGEAGNATSPAHGHGKPPARNLPAPR